MIANVIAATAAVAAIASIIVALRTYREQVRSRQIQWLLDLRQRLLEDERFSALRLEIGRHMSTAPGEDTMLAKAIRKKRSGNPADTFALTDQELGCLGAVNDYLDFFGILEQLVEDNKLREMDVYSAFNSDVDTMGRSDLLALELRDYPLTMKLIKRHEQIFVKLHPDLVNTPRATIL
jgi:hypothetical protein